MEERSLTLLSPPPPDNELTVGKVYAALMIFDYYKQTRAKRLQQQNTGGTQVQCVTAQRGKHSGLSEWYDLTFGFKM